MIYFLIVAVIIATAYFTGKINLALKFAGQVANLFAQSGNVSDKKFRYKQIEGLPEPVQRYFKHVLKEGQPYINYIRLKHDGQFKTNLKKAWVNIEGEQYFTTEEPGFIWKGETSLFVARDMYIAGRGRLIATILSLINVADVKGPSYNQGELLRWLSESVWFPTNYLPGNNMQWTGIDNLSAKLTFHYNGLELFYIVTFNEIGEIVQLETKRYMDEESLQSWVVNLSEYEEINDIIIPTKAEVFWRLKEGDFSYAKFQVRTIEYNIPEKF